MNRGLRDEVRAAVGRAVAERPGRLLSLALGGVMVAAGVALFVSERKRPLRRRNQAEPRRTLRNLALGGMSLATVALLQKPTVDRLSELVERRRIGLAQRLPLPDWARDAVAFLALDYTIYLWHVLTHRVEFLWRFHLVHHIDLDMDTTTALRFHAADMVLSMPWRAGQVLLCGASPRAWQLWQAFFFTSVLFHHSNLRLPWWLERRLARVLTTPRLHGIHHDAVRGHTDSNWSSGLSLWDWLHGTGRLDVPQDDIVIGVPAFRKPEEVALGPSLRLPFGAQKDAWEPAPGFSRSG